ncbi:MAG: SH3 domain-containing protein, partial [Bacillaceae bacterium]
MNSKLNKVLSVPIALSVGAVTLSSSADLQLISKASASTKYEYVVVADSLRVRENPSTNSKQIGSVKKKEKLVVQKELSNGWLQIKFKGKAGYVSEEYVKKQPVSQQPQPEPSKKYEYVVATNVLNVRDEASVLGNLLGTYKMGDKLQVEKELSNGWLQIKFKGRTAYVSMDYVLKQPV